MGTLLFHAAMPLPPDFNLQPAHALLSSGHQVSTEIRAAGADAVAPPVGNRGPPSLLVRVASAFMYIVPWIDCLGLGREVYHFFTNSLLLYLLPGARAPPQLLREH